MNMYKQYLEERTPGKSLISSDKGFASFHIRQTAIGKEFYIEDLYIKQESRRKKESGVLLSEIIKKAKEEDCNFISCTVVPSSEKSTESVQTIVSYNFKLWCSEDNLIWFKIDL